MKWLALICSVHLYWPGDPVAIGASPEPKATTGTPRADAPEEPRALFAILKGLADRGIPEAQYHVGMMYNNGYGTETSLAAAYLWFQRAAAGGDPLAEYKLGCYYAGQAPGVVLEDERQAFAHKLVAAKAGYSLAQYDVGILNYKQGNTNEAIRWWRMAAEQGVPMALYNLSTIYKAGEASANPVLAYAYFKLAKLTSEGHLNPRAQAALTQLAATMSAADVARAERIVAEWKPRPTALTTKALSGLMAAKKFAEASQ